MAEGVFEVARNRPFAIAKRAIATAISAPGPACPASIVGRGIVKANPSTTADYLSATEARASAGKARCSAAQMSVDSSVAQALGKTV